MKDPIFNMHDVILLLTIAGCFLLAVFQFFLPNKSRASSIILGVFFLSVGLGSLATLLLWNAYIHIENHWIKNALPYFFATALLLKGLSLYFYVASITQQPFNFRKKDALHLFPVLICFLALAIWHINSDSLRFVGLEVSNTSPRSVNLLWYFLKMAPSAYALAALVLAYKYNTQLKDYYSNLSMQGPTWLSILTFGFAANWLWSFVVHILGSSINKRISDELGIADNYITFLLVNSLFVYSLVYAHLLIAAKADVKEAQAQVPPSDSAIEKIRQGMEVDHLYLKHNLNIEEFSRRIGLPYREVSNTINKHFETNFFEYVNLYRVNKVKELLADPKFSDKTILDILFEAGFNSKSAFHRFFKRYVGMSAAEYRKQLQAKPAAIEKLV